MNARDVKHLPGRPKTDRLDAVWLCKVAERQMLRPSFVPPPAFRELRDLTRYRVDLITTRVTPSSVNQSAIASNDRVIVVYVRTSCMRRARGP